MLHWRYGSYTSGCCGLGGPGFDGWRQFARLSAGVGAAYPGRQSLEYPGGDPLLSGPLPAQRRPGQPHRAGAPQPLAYPGVRRRRTRPAPGVALRQGMLLAVAVLTLALLAFFQFLDVVFVLVTFLLVGLLEAFLQSRGR